MSKPDPFLHNAAAKSAALLRNAEEDQERAIFLMQVQSERGDMFLFDMVWRYARMPRPARQDVVALNFSLFDRLKRLCDGDEYEAWSGLMIGTAIRGDAEGQRLVETMVRHRLAF